MTPFLISVPNKQHYLTALSLLGKVSFILLEKPATTKITDLKKLINASMGTSTLLVVAFHAMFAKDLLWFKKQYKTNLKKILGLLTGFRCEFYDPLIMDGVFTAQASSLGGSWIDSGINALSVISDLLDVDSLYIEESLLSKIPQFDSSDIQGIVNFIFSVNHDKAGRGNIQTNWIYGKNRKTTRLYYGNTNNEILLQHSEQKVLLIDAVGEETVLADFSATNERLINHYIGVFEDFHCKIIKNETNIDMALKLHKLLFLAYQLSIN